LREMHYKLIFAAPKAQEEIAGATGLICVQSRRSNYLYIVTGECYYVQGGDDGL